MLLSSPLLLEIVRAIRAKHELPPTSCVCNRNFPLFRVPIDYKEGYIMPTAGLNRFILSALTLSVGVAGPTLANRPLSAAPSEKTAPLASGENLKRNVAAHPLSEDEKIVHVLNRLGFGPRPGDVQKVKAMGLSRYIDLQLHPERIEDSAMDRQIASYAQLQLSGDQLAEEYNAFLGAAKQAQGVNKAAKKQAGRETAAQEAANGGQMPATPSDKMEAMEPAAGGKAAKGAKPKKALKGAGAGTDTMTPMQAGDMRAMRQELMQTALPVTQAHEQFMAAKMVRAAESERQLQEVLADFWNNHFNIDLRRAPCGILKIADDRDAIRPHILGKFRDMLGASAHSPAMLVYLDNYMSTADPGAETADPTPVRRMRLKAVPAKKKQMSGLNENYAREIMELHTLGVDGGYTQNDVHEVARCFTGWSIASPDGRRRPGQGKYSAAGAFRFAPAMHDNGAKVVLGQTIPAGGGIQDGERVLDILASHPATMKHVSYQLCQRFVADTPPPSLVNKCVETWKRTNGDLREITRTIVTSPEFYAPATYRSKIKSPFEYAVSSVRALGGTIADVAPIRGRKPGQGPARVATSLIKPPKGGGYLDASETTLLGQVGAMGQPLFQYQAPTGYPEDSSKWVSAGALISRLNFALALTDGKLGDVAGVSLPTAPTDAKSITSKEAGQLMDTLALQILHAPVAPTTRATLLKQMNGDAPGMVTASTSSGSVTATRIAALLLGSPEFQRR